MCEARRTKKHTLPGVMITILYANIMKLLYYREIPPLQRAESTLCSSHNWIGAPWNWATLESSYLGFSYRVWEDSSICISSPVLPDGFDIFMSVLMIHCHLCTCHLSSSLTELAVTFSNLVNAVNIF